MIDDCDVWQATALIVKRYGDDAMLKASDAVTAARDRTGHPADARRRQ